MLNYLSSKLNQNIEESKLRCKKIKSPTEDFWGILMNHSYLQ